MAKIPTHSSFCIVALVTCKNEEDPFKNEGTRVCHNRSFINCKSMQILFQMLKGS